MPDMPFDGDFATPAVRRRERRWQAGGLFCLLVVLGASLAGRLGDPATLARATVVYAFLLAVFRISGRRTMAQVTNFDLVLVLIIGDATQQALIGDDFTLTTALLAVSTLVVLDVALGWAKQRWAVVDRLVDGLPLPIVVGRRIDHEQMASEGITTDDLLTAARERAGVTRLDDIEHAVLEPGGTISIVPTRAQQP